MLNTKMKEKLKKFGLLKESVQKLDIPKDTFIDYFSEMIGPSEEIKMIGKPKYEYFGWIDDSIFEVTENQKPFGNTSSAKLTGVINSTESGIELHIESILLAVREYVFLGAGFSLFIGGLIKILINFSTDIETILIAPFGLIFIGFTYLYMRKDAKLAIKNFDSRIIEIKRRHNKNKQEV